MIRTLFSVAFSIALLMASCGAGKEISIKRDDGPVRRIINRELYQTFTGDSTELRIAFDYYPSEEQVVQQQVNSAICRSIKRVTSFEDERDTCSLSEGMVRALLDSFASMYYEDELDDSQIWSLGAEADITEYKDYIRLDWSEWTYLGGAHGNGIFEALLFDRTTGSVLRVEDFFSDVPELTKIAEKHFRTLMGLSSDQDLTAAGFWFDGGDFDLNNNFYFSEGNLVFYYNTYEIGPYSGGPTSLEIPLSEIRYLLKRGTGLQD